MTPPETHPDHALDYCRRLMQAIAKLRKLPPADRRLALQMLALAATVRVSLLFFRVNKIKQMLLRSGKRFPLTPIQLDIDRTAYFIGVASRKLRQDGPCLTQALAMYWMLVRAGMPAAVILGVKRGTDGQVIGHAWLECNGSVVIGGPAEVLVDYIPLAGVEDFS